MIEVFSTILYKNEFQNPQIFQQTIASVFFLSNLLKHLLEYTAAETFSAKPEKLFANTE
jgi:hypothetical protein